MSIKTNVRSSRRCVAAGGWLLAVVLTAACSARDTPVTAADGGAVTDGTDAGVSVIADCTPGNPYCADGSVPDGGATCGNAPIDLEPVGVNVMIAVDGSKAMSNHWELMQNAIKKLIEENLSLNFGVHLFWSDVSSLEMLFDKLNFCGTTQNHVLDVAPGQQTAILPFLGAVPPGPGADFYSFRPVVEPLNYYLENASRLTDPKSTNYLVFISNGADNCFGTIFAQNADKLLTYEKLGIELVKRNIRVLPIGFDGATAERTPSRRDAGTLMTNFEALDRLAVFGGAGLTKALTADSTEGLQQAIETVSKAVRSCRFGMPDALDPAKNLNPFALEFLVNGISVPRDRTHKNGWDFVNGNTSQAETFGEPCTAIRAGNSLTVRTRCSTDDVCGTAATKLSTKKRAIQFLLDASASMLACSNPDFFQCLPAPVGTSELLWWQVAVRSIATAVVSTVNDDAEFGLQYLPGRGTGLVSCETSPQPEVPPRDGSEIAVIGSALSTLPLGQTPLVAALESIAENPGRLAEPGVSGALVVMSDGGNSCGDILAEDAVRRLAEATTKLRAKGVTVHVVKLGNGSLAEEDAQLQSIAVNGGAPRSGSVAYLEAPMPGELDTVLAELSDRLASCELELGEPPQNANKDNVNLYIDGALIPFDGQGTKLDGWGWKDAERQTMMMHGNACVQFKSSRAANIVVEFGCMSVPLL